MREGKGVGLVADDVNSVILISPLEAEIDRHVLDQVKDSKAIADWRQKTCPIWGVDEVPFAVYCSQQIRKLVRLLSLYGISERVKNIL